MLVDDIFKIVNDTIDSTPAWKLGDFVDSNPAHHWIIASDYVINDKNRNRNSYCYTIFPVWSDIVVPMADIQASLPKDLKETRDISDAAIAMLRSEKNFSFCFVNHKGQAFFHNGDDVRGSLDATIAILTKRTEWSAPLKFVSTIRQKAEAKSFNPELLSNISLVILFASILAMRITLLSSPQSISWFSDRDSIVTAHDQFANALFNIQYYQACHENGVQTRGTKLVIGIMGMTNWYDAYIRIPDYHAGTLAAFDPESNSVASEKHLDLLTKIISSSNNIVIIDFSIVRNKFECRELVIRQNPSARAPIST